LEIVYFINQNVYNMKDVKYRRIDRAKLEIKKTKSSLVITLAK